MPQHLQAKMDQRAVFAGQRHQIGDGGDGDQIQQPLFPMIVNRCGQKIFVVPKGSPWNFFKDYPYERLHQLKNHTRAGEHLVRIRIAGAFRIHNGVGVRQNFRCQVMIGDNYRQSQTICFGHRPDIADTAINGDDQFNAVLRERRECLIIQAVRFLVAVGNVDGKILKINLFKKRGEHRRARHAVGIVIGENGDSVVVFNRYQNPRRRARHIQQQKRIMEIAVVIRRQKIFNLRLSRQSSFSQQRTQ